MSEAPVQLVIATFADEQGAEAAIKALQATRKEQLTGVQAAIAIRKDTQNRFHYRDVGMTPGKGALGGVILGAVVGIISGGTVLVLGAAGAALGSLVGRKRQDRRFAPERLNQVAASLAPGSSALVAVGDPAAVAVLDQDLTAQGADVLAMAIADDIARQLSAHQAEADAVLAGALGTVSGDEAAPDRPASV